MAELKVTVWECDSCGKIVLAKPDLPEPSSGVVGTAVYFTEDGQQTGAPGEWFACHYRHVAKAVVNALKKAAQDVEA